MSSYKEKKTQRCNESLYLQYNTLPSVQLFNYQVFNLVHKMVYLIAVYIPEPFYTYYLYS